MMGRNVLIQLVTSSISGLLTFLTLSLTARLFGPEIIGTLAYLLGLTGLIFAFSDLGFSRAHVYYTASKQAASRTLGTFIRIKMILLLISSLLAIIVYRFFGQNYSWVIFGLILIYELLSRFSETILITFEALQQAIPQNLTKLISKLAKLIMVIILTQRLRNVLGLSLTFIAEGFILLLLSLYLIRRFIPLSYDKSLFQKYFRYSLPFFVIIPLSYLQTNSLIVILKQFWPVKEVGFYSAAANLTGFIKTLYGAVMIFFFPKIASLYAVKDMKSIQHYTNLTIKYLLIIFTPIFIGLFLLRQEIIVLVLGADFISAIPIYSLFLLGMFLLMLFNPYSYVLFACHHHRPLVKINVISLFLTIILSFLMIPYFGARGAVLVNIIIWIINGMWILKIIKQRLQLKIMPYFYNFIIPALLLLILSEMIINFYNLTLIIKLLITLISLSLYLVFLYSFKVFNKKDIHYFISLIPFARK